MKIYIAITNNRNMHKFLLIKHPDEITEQLQDLTEHTAKITTSTQ